VALTHRGTRTTDGDREAARGELSFSGAFERTIGVEYLADGWQLRMDGKSSMPGANSSGTELSMQVDGATRRASIYRRSAAEWVFFDGEVHALAPVDPLTVTPVAAAGPAGLRSPCPGG
jgi:hypothetical protein